MSNTLFYFYAFGFLFVRGTLCYLLSLKLRIVKKKRCVWSETAMLEHKSTCCYVLWPLEGSRRAGQCEDTLLFALVSDAVMDRKPAGAFI